MHVQIDTRECSYLQTQGSGSVPVLAIEGAVLPQWRSCIKHVYEV